MRKSSMTFRSERGFTMIELLFIVALMGIISAMAVLRMNAAQPFLQGNGAMRVIMSQMNTARQLAITQRRYMRLVFTNPNQIQIVREEVPGPATTVLATAILEGGVQFSLINSLPDTPDAFGNNAPVFFGAVVNVKFSPAGTLVNQNGVNANGSVFLALRQVQESARAITVLGSTGRIRGYRWDGRIWKEV
jgi:type II secretory pathway pseudopilin PulG